MAARSLIFFLLLLLFHSHLVLAGAPCSTRLYALTQNTYNVTQAGTFDCTVYDTVHSLLPAGTPFKDNLYLFAKIEPVDYSSEFLFLNQYVSTINEGDPTFHFTIRLIQPDISPNDWVGTVDVSFNIWNNVSCVPEEVLPNTICALSDSGTEGNTCNSVCNGFACRYAEYTCSSGTSGNRKRGVPYYTVVHSALVGINITHSDPIANFTLAGIKLQYQLDPIFVAPFTTGSSCSTEQVTLPERPTPQKEDYCHICNASDNDSIFAAYQGSIISHHVSGDGTIPSCGKNIRIDAIDTSFEPFVGIQIPLSKMGINSTSHTSISNVTFMVENAYNTFYQMVSYVAILSSRCDVIRNVAIADRYEGVTYDYNDYYFQSSCENGFVQEPYLSTYDTPPVIHDDDMYLALLFSTVKDADGSNPFYFFSMTATVVDTDTGAIVDIVTFRVRECYAPNSTVDFKTATCECSTCHDINPHSTTNDPIEYYTILPYFDHGAPPGFAEAKKRRSFESFDGNVIDYNTAPDMNQLIAERTSSQILHKDTTDYGLASLDDIQQFMDRENCGIFVRMKECSSMMEIYLNAKINARTTFLMDGDVLTTVSVVVSGDAFESAWPLTRFSEYAFTNDMYSLLPTGSTTRQQQHFFRIRKPDFGGYSSQFNVTFGVGIAVPENSPADGFYFVAYTQIGLNPIFNNSYYCQLNSTKGANLTKTKTPTMDRAIPDPMNQDPNRFHFFGTPMCQPPVKLSLCPRDGWYFNSPYSVVVDYVGPAYSFPSSDLNYNYLVDYNQPNAIFPFLVDVFFDLSKLNLRQLGWDGFNTNGNKQKQLDFVNDPSNFFYMEVYTQQDYWRFENTNPFESMLLVENGTSCVPVYCTQNVTLMKEKIPILYGSGFVFDGVNINSNSMTAYDHFVSRVDFRECLREFVTAQRFRTVDNIFTNGKLRINQAFRKAHRDYEDDKEDAVDRVFLHGVNFIGKNGSSDVYRPRNNMGDQGVDGVDSCEAEMYDYHCTCGLAPAALGFRVTSDTVSEVVSDGGGGCPDVLRIAKSTNHYQKYIGVSIPFVSLGLSPIANNVYISHVDMVLQSTTNVEVYAAYQTTCGDFSKRAATGFNTRIDVSYALQNVSSCGGTVFNAEQTVYSGAIAQHAKDTGVTAFLILFDAAFIDDRTYILNLTLTLNNGTRFVIPITDSCVPMDDSCSCKTCDGSNKGDTDLKWFISDVSLINSYANPVYALHKRAAAPSHDNDNIRAQVVDNRLNVVYKTSQHIHVFKPTEETLFNVSKTEGNMTVNEYMIRNSNCGVMLSVDECTGDLEVWFHPRSGLKVPNDKVPDSQYVSFRCLVMSGHTNDGDAVSQVYSPWAFIESPDINEIDPDYTSDYLDKATQNFYVVSMQPVLDDTLNYTMRDLYAFKIKYLAPDNMRQGLFLKCDVAIANEDLNIFFRLFDGMDYCQLNSHGGYDKTNVTFFGNVTDYTVATPQTRSQTPVLHKRNTPLERGGGPIVFPTVPPSFVITASPECEEYKLCPDNGWHINTPMSYMADYVGKTFVIPPYIDGEKYAPDKPFTLSAKYKFNQPEMLELLAFYDEAMLCYLSGPCVDQPYMNMEIHINYPFHLINSVSGSVLLMEDTCFQDAIDREDSFLGSCDLGSMIAYHGQYNVYGQSNPFLLDVNTGDPLKYYHDHFILRMNGLRDCMDLIQSAYESPPWGSLGLSFDIEFEGNNATMQPDYPSLLGHTLWSGVKFSVYNSSMNENIYYRPDRDCEQVPFEPPVECSGVCPIYLFNFGILDDAHAVNGQLGNHPNSSSTYEDVFFEGDTITSFDIFQALGTISDAASQVFEGCVPFINQLRYEGNGMVIHFKVITDDDQEYHQIGIFTFDPSMLHSFFINAGFTGVFPFQTPGVFIDSDPDNTEKTRVFGTGLGVIFTLNHMGQITMNASMGIANFRPVLAVLNTLYQDTHRDMINMDADVTSEFVDLQPSQIMIDSTLSQLQGSSVLLWDLQKSFESVLDFSDPSLFNDDIETKLALGFTDGTYFRMGDGIDEEGIEGALPVVDSLYSTFGAHLNEAVSFHPEFAFPYFHFFGDESSAGIDYDYDEQFWDGSTIIQTLEIKGRIKATLFPCATTCSHNATHRVKNHPDANLNSLVADVLNPSTNDESGIVNVTGVSPVAQYGDISSFQNANLTDIFAEDGDFRMGLALFANMFAPGFYLSSVHNFDADHCRNILRDIGSPISDLQGNFSINIYDDIGMYMNMRDGNHAIQFYGITCTTQLTTDFTPYSLPAMLKPVSIQLSLFGYVKGEFSMDYTIAPSRFTRTQDSSTLTYNNSYPDNDRGHFDVIAKIDSDVNFTTDIVNNGRFNDTILFNPNATAFPDLLTIRVYEPVNHTVEVRAGNLNIQNYGFQNSSFMGIVEKCNNMFDDEIVFRKSKSQSQSHSMSPSLEASAGSGSGSGGGGGSSSGGEEETTSQSESDSNSQSESPSWSTSESSSESIKIHTRGGASVVITPVMIAGIGGGVLAAMIITIIACSIAGNDSRYNKIK